jgi:hypothetical protein
MRSKSFTTAITLAIAAAGLTASAQKAATPTAPPVVNQPIPKGMLSRPAYPAAEPEKKQFVIEYVYHFTETDYSPAVVMQPVTRATAKYDTPEATFSAMIAAMRSGDYDWWLTLWDDTSQQILKDEAEHDKYNAAFYRNAWQRAYQGKDVVLVRRLDIPTNVLLEFRIGAPQPGKGEQLSPVVLRRLGVRWYLTQELAPSPFLQGQLSTQPVVSEDVPFVPQPAFAGGVNIFQQVQLNFFKVHPTGADSATEVAW